MSEQSRYRLRKAAGLYWLIDMEQSGKQVMLNEAGALIWEKYERLKSERAVAEEISREFGIPAEEGLEDVRQFLSQLKSQGLEL